ncbi:hypothetical protein J4Q44_G00253700 [Coregonus suidteri]|uniref:Uncharacterized protein n=1 Tax=Coregonus suidteri TaxID=861788 RepID=A0AAN8L9K2_9TELE
MLMDSSNAPLSSMFNEPHTAGLCLIYLIASRLLRTTHCSSPTMKSGPSLVSILASAPWDWTSPGGGVTAHSDNPG